MQINGRRLPRLEVRNRAWLTRGGQPVLGERHLEILEALREVGSLNAAAKRLRISYRDAWGKIRQAEAALGVKLISVQIGGRSGGGSRLTPAGEDLITRLRVFHSEQRHAAARSATVFFGGTSAASRASADTVRFATTTSVVDSGLLALLLPPFTRRFGIAVDVLPVGSGAALRLAHSGNADVVLAHAPEAEARAVRHGDVLNRRPVMTNDFVVVGPRDDPAAVRGARAVRIALQRIATTRAPFLSRNDGSGTHQRERTLLLAAGIKPGAWFRRARSGMAEMLRRASKEGAYLLADRSTVVALADSLALDILFAGDACLMNAYSVLATNPDHHPQARYVEAMALIGWFTSPAVQELIATYRVGGHAVARPAAVTSRS